MKIKGLLHPSTWPRDHSINLYINRVCFCIGLCSFISIPSSPCPSDIQASCITCEGSRDVTECTLNSTGSFQTNAKVQLIYQKGYKCTSEKVSLSFYPRLQSFLLIISGQGLLNVHSERRYLEHRYPIYIASPDGIHLQFCAELVLLLRSALHTEGYLVVEDH